MPTGSGWRTAAGHEVGDLLAQICEAIAGLQAQREADAP